MFKDGKNYANRKFVVYCLDRQKEHLRVGLSVSKKLGNAVVRNQIKRRLRHVLQEFQDQILPYDIVVIARKGVEDLDYDEIKQHLRHVLMLAKLYKEELP